MSDLIRRKSMSNIHIPTSIQVTFFQHTNESTQ